MDGLKVFEFHVFWQLLEQSLQRYLQAHLLRYLARKPLSFQPREVQQLKTLIPTLLIRNFGPRH